MTAADQVSLSAMTVSELALRLNERMVQLGRKPLKTIHVISTELTNGAGWSPNQTRQDQQDLNEILGEQAMGFVARELTNTLNVNMFGPHRDIRKNGDENYTFRVGLATGSTIFKLVDSLVIPRAQCNVEISPLVIGPVPETMYSAGFIANLFVKRFDSPDLVRLSKICQTEYDFLKKQLILSLNNDAIHLRDGDKDIGSRGKVFADKFDWILTGIGAHGIGQLEVHEQEIYTTTQVPSNVVGDICSRLFDKEGNEPGVTKDVSDTVVAVSFEAMERMCRTDNAGKRVIAIAGGRQKYAAIIALLTRKNPLFNVLITDELTARRLIFDLKKPVRAKS